MSSAIAAVATAAIVDDTVGVIGPVIVAAYENVIDTVIVVVDVDVIGP